MIKIYRQKKMKYNSSTFKEEDHPRGKDGKFGKGGKGKETERKELFERAKEKNPKLSRWAIDESAIDENGDYIIYHGTNEENYKKIMTEGLIAPDAPRFFTTTTKKETAEEFAKGYSGDKVIKFAIPLDEITDVLWKGGKTSAYNDTQHALKTGFLDKKYIKHNAVRIYRNAADQSEFNFDEDKHKRDAGGRFTSGGGGGSKKTDKKEIKKKEKLTTLNPTGGIFVDYKPEDIMDMELGENITTLAETAGFDSDEKIKVYRGISTGSGAIGPGDFITTNEQLAKDYAGTGKVISETVRAGDILDDSDEPLGEEYIYYPKEKPDEKKKYLNSSKPRRFLYRGPRDGAGPGCNP